MRRLDFSIALLVCLFGSVVVAQYDDDFGSPVPPRPNIPGAFQLSGGGASGGAAFRKPVFRAQGRRQQAPIQSADTLPPARIRSNKPIGRAGRFPAQPLPSSIQPHLLSPAPTPIISRPPPIPQESIPPRPVIEEGEDLPTEEDLSPLSIATPSAFPPLSNSIPLVKQPPPSSFRPEKPFRPVLSPSPAPEYNFPTPTRQQLRPTPPPEEPQYTRSSQFNRAQQVVRTQPPKQQFQKPPPQQEHHSGQRSRKPVAQVLRKYREDNPDGSITWGFENDDGSYKEETIGVDCVTRGKYGYVDPDGVRREYTYSSGIPCDKMQEVESEGYIDYQNNKYVLPNGDAIDLNSMVKNRARKPVQVYRN